MKDFERCCEVDIDFSFTALSIAIENWIDKKKIQPNVIFVDVSGWARAQEVLKIYKKIGGSFDFEIWSRPEYKLGDWSVGFVELGYGSKGA